MAFFSEIKKHYYYSTDVIEYVEAEYVEGFEFVSWYYDDNFENECIFPLELRKDITIYAKYAKLIEVKIADENDNIIKEYTSGEIPLYHMDVYRLEDTDESIGFNDYFNKGGVTIIEWADIIKDKLPEKRLDIKFKFIDEDTRVLVLIPHGEEYEEICNAVL